MSALQFRDLVSGRRSGVVAAMARALLRAAEIPYAAAVAWRNGRFDRGAGVERVGVPVISVGNLTLGGTGKTPLVEWLARWFRAANVRVVLVSRGYGARAGAVNDEALELAQSLPDVPHLQDPVRVRAARRAIQAHGAQVILLDDGFQHRGLARDLDIVLIDALEPFGFGHVFPRGMLREPVASLRRADVVALSRADLVDSDRRVELRREVERHAPQAMWLELAHRPRVLRNAAGREASLDMLRGRRVAAFCGIGNPAAFRRALAECGYDVVAFRELADHQVYDAAELKSLSNWIAKLDVAAVVCTRKDAVKIPTEQLGAQPLWALTVGLEFLKGEQDLVGRLPSLGG